MIRLSPDGDGGYLVLDNLEGIEACFSPGADVISEFELACLQRKMKVFMADKSVEKPTIDLSQTKYSFINKFIECTNNENFITMDEWVKLSNVSSSTDLLLQIDIEGSEYNTIINMSDSLMKRFRIMAIEFHKLEILWSPDFFEYANIAFRKILQTHICVHIHPNNCCGVYSHMGIDIPRVAEFTFLEEIVLKK